MKTLRRECNVQRRLSLRLGSNADPLLFAGFDGTPRLSPRRYHIWDLGPGTGFSSVHVGWRTETDTLSWYIKSRFVCLYGR